MKTTTLSSKLLLNLNYLEYIIQTLILTNSLDTIFTSFFRKTISFCILYEKEKKEKLETLIDWIRNLIIKKAKSHNILLHVLEEQYINLLNALGKLIYTKI